MPRTCFEFVNNLFISLVMYYVVAHVIFATLSSGCKSNLTFEFISKASDSMRLTKLASTLGSYELEVQIQILGVQ